MRTRIASASTASQLRRARRPRSRFHLAGWPFGHARWNDAHGRPFYSCLSFRYKRGPGRYPVAVPRVRLPLQHSRTGVIEAASHRRHGRRHSPPPAAPWPARRGWRKTPRRRRIPDRKRSADRQRGDRGLVRTWSTRPQFVQLLRHLHFILNRTSRKQIGMTNLGFAHA